MKFNDYVNICMACPFKTQDGGFHLCVDGKNIINHCASGECPKGRYALTVIERQTAKPSAEKIKQIVDKAKTMAAATTEKKDCGCNRRKQ